MTYFSLLFLNLVIALQIFSLSTPTYGFKIEPIRRSTTITLRWTKSPTSTTSPIRQLREMRTFRSSIIFQGKEDDDPYEKEGFTIFRGSGDDQLTDDIWEDLESGQPPKWLVVKELLGISAITYVLAAAIVITLGLNIALGPGWLGQAIGLSGTGSFTETSGAIPESLDLSDPVYLL